MVKMLLPKKLGIIDAVIEKMAKSDACLLRYKEHINRKLCNHLRRTPDHPAYAFMIRRAIAELKGSEAPSEEEISDFIREEYKNEILSVAHASMVKFHLVKLCDKGEILCTTENRYIFPRVKKQKRGRQSISRHESEKDNQSREELILEHMDQQNLENQNHLHEEQVTVVHVGNKELNICVFEEHPLAEVCQPNEALGSFHEKDTLWEIENQLHSEKPTGEMVAVNDQQQTKESENVGDEVVRQEAEGTEENRYLKVSVGKEIEVNDLNGIEHVDDVGNESKSRLQQSKVLEYQVKVMKEQNHDHNSATEVLSSIHAKYMIWEIENQLHSDKPIGEMVGANNQQQTKESMNVGDDLVLQEAEVAEENQDLEAPMSEKFKENVQNGIQEGEVLEPIVEFKGQNTSSQALSSLHEKQAHCDSERLSFKKPVSEAVGANDQQQTKESKNIVNVLMLPEAEVIEQLNPKYINALHLSANKLLELESEANMTGLPNLSPESQPSEEAIQAITSMKGIFTGMLSRTKEMQQGLENMVEFFSVFDGSKNSSQPTTGEMASGHLLKLFDDVDMLRKQCELPSLKRALETTETCHKLEQKLKRQKRNPDELCDKQFSQEPESKEQQEEKCSHGRSEVVSEEPYIKKLEQMEGDQQLEMQIQTFSNPSRSKPHLVSQRQLRPRIDGVVLPYPYLGKNIIEPRLISLCSRRGRPPKILVTNIEEASPSQLNGTETTDHFEAEVSPNQQLKKKRGRGRPRILTTDNEEQVLEYSSGPNDTEIQDHGTDGVKSKMSRSNDHNHIGNGRRKKRKPGPGRPRKEGSNENAEQILAHPLSVCSGADKKSGRGRGRPPKLRLIGEATIGGYCPANFCPG